LFQLKKLSIFNLILSSKLEKKTLYEKFKIRDSIVSKIFSFAFVVSKNKILLGISSKVLRRLFPACSVNLSIS
jgi:hypothetical protein